MLLSSLVFLGGCAGFGLSLAMPETGSGNGVSLPKLIRTRGVPLEFNRIYTKAELDELAAGFEKRVPAPYPTLDNRSGSPTIGKRDPTSGSITVTGHFLCSGGGELNAQMETEVNITDHQSTGAGSLGFFGLLNINSFSFGDSVAFGVPPVEQSNIAIYTNCVNYGGTICTYDFRSSIDASILADDTPFGAATPYISDLDAGQPTLTENCAQTSDSGNTCPAASSSECDLLSWNTDSGS